jgi:hypothetical protein
MAERKSGLPVDPTSPLISQIIAPLVPMSYQVDRPYSVNAEEVDGGYIYSETPMKASDLQFGTPPIISGGIEFFKSLMENPTETASGIATAVADELVEYPKRQIRTAMSGGEYYNPETGEVERFDPFSVPATTALGTASSLAKVAPDGSVALGMLGGSRMAGGKDQIEMAKQLRKMGKSDEEVYRSTGVYFDEDVLGSPNFAGTARIFIPTKDVTFQPDAAMKKDVTYGTGEVFGLSDSIVGANITPQGTAAFTGDNFANLDEVINFPQLFEKYPQLRDVQVARLEPLQDETPFDLPQAIHIKANESSTGKSIIAIRDQQNSQKALSAILHEVQHEIQDIEGHYTGGSAIEIFNILEERYPDLEPAYLRRKAFDLYEGLYGEAEARTVQRMFENPDEQTEYALSVLRREAPANDIRADELDAVDSLDEDDLLEEATAYNDEGIAPFASVIGKAISESRAPASNTNVTKFGFYQDNPDIYRGNNEYTQSNAAYVERTMPEGSDYLRGPQTAILGRDMSQTYSKGPKQEKPLMLPAELLHRLPGSMHEARSARNPDVKYDSLAETVAEEGFDRSQKESGGVIVGVNHLGQAYIIEGNTRAALAFDQGIPSIKAEVRYYNGGEMVDGPFSPQRMAAYSDFGIQTGGAMFSESRTRPTDLVSAVDLGGGRQGIAGLAHGVKRGAGTDKKVQIRVADLQRVNESLQEPAQNLMKYAEDNNLIGPDGNIFIDRAELITVTGLDNRIRKAFLKASGAKSAEVDREGFSLSGDPFLSYKEFAGESPDRREMDQLLVAETFDLARGDVQDLSPAEYLMAEYDPSVRALKKPNTKFFEDETHVGKDSQNYINMRAMTGTERKRFRNIANRNDALLARAQDSYNKFYKSRDGIFELARGITKGFQGIEGAHQKRSLELYTINPLATNIAEPAVQKALIKSLGDEEARELFGLLQAYKNSRVRAIGDNVFNQEVFEENGNVVRQIYRDDLAQTHPDFAKDLKVDTLGERGETFMGFRFDPRFVEAMREHSQALQSGEGIEETTKALEAFPMHKRMTFVDDDGVIKFRALSTDPRANLKNPYFRDLEDDIEVAMRHINAVRKYEGTPDEKKLLVERAINHIDNNIPMGFADPLKQMVKTSETAREKARATINSRPKASEFNQAYRDYQNATQAVVDKFAEIADHGPKSPLFNYVGPNKPAIEGRGYALQGPETKFKHITVRDNPAVKFEKGGPVRAGIADFIPYMVQ